MQRESSYSASDVEIPVKVLHDVKLVWEATANKRILLRHLQLCPTNRCNLNCNFCSCADRQKNSELSFGQAQSILKTAKKLGCNAITITGGGEPLLHPDINEIIETCDDLNIGTGLVTNGLLLGNLKRLVDWCRISVHPGRDWKELSSVVADTVPVFDTDWAFSYVLTALDNLVEVVEFANNHNFTHVRVVSDILNPDERLMDKARKLLKGIDCKVIYQDRAKPTRGAQKCLISLLKPTISAEGMLYPCCGSQYSERGQKRDFLGTMGASENMESIWAKQQHYIGTFCEVCYYSGYNKLLGLLTQDICHKEWC